MSRSYLFVPADSERKLARGRDADADALIIDLEDSVAAGARPAARKLAAEFLAEDVSPERWVRINPLDTEDSVKDLEAVLPAAPNGIVLPKPEGAFDANRLASLLDDLEKAHGVEQGSTRILPIATEVPVALFHMHEYVEATSRLSGLTWGAEDLGAAVGATTMRSKEGRWLPPYQLARSLCLFAAAAAVVPAIDTVFTDFKDDDGLAEYAGTARRDGFEGMLAIHPGQVGIINEAFMPTDTEIERARRIVDLFADNPNVGALSLDGEMVDRPHLRQAERVLANATKK